MLVCYYKKGKNYSKKDTDNYILNTIKIYEEKNNITINNKEIKRTEKGKPYINGVQNIYVSVSHTDSLVVIAICNSNVGIDTEYKNRKVKNYNSIINKYFFAKEKDYINAQNDTETKQIRFIEVWTKKEAYLKFTGSGLSKIKEANIYSVPGRFKTIICKDHLISVYTEKTAFDITEVDFT